MTDQEVMQSLCRYQNAILSARFGGGLALVVLIRTLGIVLCESAGLVQLNPAVQIRYVAGPHLILQTCPEESWRQILR